MPATAEQILADALNLPSQQRAQLAEELFSSLKADQDAFEQRWAKEAESRIDAYERGDIRSTPVKTVFKNVFGR